MFCFARNISCAVGEQAPHDFTAIHFVRMHKFHLANHTTHNARVLGALLIAGEPNSTCVENRHEQSAQTKNPKPNIKFNLGFYGRNAVVLFELPLKKWLEAFCHKGL